VPEDVDRTTRVHASNARCEQEDEVLLLLLWGGDGEPDIDSQYSRRRVDPRGVGWWNSPSEEEEEESTSSGVEEEEEEDSWVSTGALTKISRRSIQAFLSLPSSSSSFVCLVVVLLLLSSSTARREWWLSISHAVFVCPLRRWWRMAAKK